MLSYNEGMKSFVRTNYYLFFFATFLVHCKSNIKTLRYFLQWQPVALMLTSGLRVFMSSSVIMAFCNSFSEVYLICSFRLHFNCRKAVSIHCVKGKLQVNHCFSGKGKRAWKTAIQFIELKERTFVDRKWVGGIITINANRWCRYNVRRPGHLPGMLIGFAFFYAYFDQRLFFCSPL